MKVSRGIFVFTFILLLLMLEANALISKEYCSAMTGTVVGVQGMFRKWLEVKSNQEGGNRLFQDWERYSLYSS